MATHSYDPTLLWLPSISGWSSRAGATGCVKHTNYA